MAKKKNVFAQAMAKLRVKKLSPARRSEIASNAAKAKHAKERERKAEEGAA